MERGRGIGRGKGKETNQEPETPHDGFAKAFRKKLIKGQKKTSELQGQKRSQIKKDQETIW